MAEENIAESLAAVEKALEHFNTSLIRSGFADGAASYQKMAEIIVGQWMWASSQGIDQHNDRFRRVAALATEIHEQLLPYVEGMRKLALLRELVPEPKPEPPFPPDSRPARILQMLAAAPRPASGGFWRDDCPAETAAPAWVPAPAPAAAPACACLRHRAATARVSLSPARRRA